MRVSHCNYSFMLDALHLNFQTKIVGGQQHRNCDGRLNVVIIMRVVCCVGVQHTVCVACMFMSICHTRYIFS